MFKPTEQTTILDVGGYYHFWRDLPLQPQITLVNIDDPPPSEELPPNFTFVSGDGRSLPFPAQSFDIVFSNSVIEHVGTYEDQQRFAQEVRRVGRSSCVQTPNRSFPLEPHFIGPSSPYLPRELQRFIFRWCSLRGWLRRWDHADFDALFNDVRLLSYLEMRSCPRLRNYSRKTLRPDEELHRSSPGDTRPIVKLLVFAHTPPPHHGQSYMVKLMLDGLGGDWRRKKSRNDGPAASDRRNATEQHSFQTFDGIQCYHVDTRFSHDISDLGTVRLGKFFLVFRYCFEAIWCRFRYGADTFHFAPAPPKRPALYRDWLVMLICRPFFRRFVHHWHAVGLADWLLHEGNWIVRWLTLRLLGKPSLGLAVATANLHDALWLETSHVKVVQNGIPDPFPDFETNTLPLRNARLEARRCLLRGESLPAPLRKIAGVDADVFRILYLGYCFREKGIFEMLDGVARAQTRLRTQAHPLTLHLTVAGDFSSTQDRAEFMRRIAQPDLAGVVSCTAFVEGVEKKRLLRESDCLCFPTYCDSFGLVVLEAMAIGLNVIATIWGALPEILPAGYPGFVPIRDSQAIAETILIFFIEDATHLRSVFLERFTDTRHLAQLQAALLSIESASERNASGKSMP